MELDLPRATLDEMLWFLGEAVKTDLTTFLHMWSHLPLHRLTAAVDGGELEYISQVEGHVTEIRQDFETNVAPLLSSTLKAVTELERFLSEGRAWLQEDRESWQYKLGSSVSGMRIHLRNMLNLWPDLMLFLPALRIQTGETETLEQVRDLGYFLTYECGLWADRFSRWQRNLEELAAEVRAAKLRLELDE